MSVYYHNLVIFEIVDYNTVVEILSRNENGRYEEVRSKRQKKKTHASVMQSGRDIVAREPGRCMAFSYGEPYLAKENSRNESFSFIHRRNDWNEENRWR